MNNLFMKTLGIAILSLCGLCSIIYIYSFVVYVNNYTNDIYGYWTLADKSSTIEAKSEYINKFVSALDNAGLSGYHNAIFFKNQDNSFDLNLKALKTLSDRLEQIKTMDSKSFEYQQAIQQITAQEQGEAEDMLNVFKGCWTLKNYPMVYDTVIVILLIPYIAIFIVGLLLTIEY